MTGPGRAAWWRDCVTYQLYLRSFADSDGDGVGDLDGVRQHLDHLVGLGVDALWINPCYPSPHRDGGYDVADFTAVDAAYGGPAAFERLLAAAHDRGLRVLMDLVPNHCSSDHAWFREALASAPGSPARARFHFREGRGTDGAQPPNNWLSTFGGPAWTRVDEADGAPGQWYLHSFDATQPDFNWDDASVNEMFDDVLRLWFDRGIDGFRIDVAYAMVKHPDLPDVADPTAYNPHQWNQPGVHDILRRWRKLAESYDRELALVGEAWLPPRALGDYVAADELTGIFCFDLLQQPFDAAAVRTSVAETLAGLPDDGGVPAWTLNNHDVHRAVTRYGIVEPEPVSSPDPNTARVRPRGRVDLALGTARAQAMTLLMLGLPGSVFLYQGEELGLPEVQDLEDAVRRDPIWTRSRGTEHGRDGSRVPLPWTEHGPSFGFSADGAAAPWLPQPPWFGEHAVSRLTRDPRSVLASYRTALETRRRHPGTADLEWLAPGRDDVLAFARGGLTVVTVFAGESFEVPADWGRLALRSSDGEGRRLSTGTTAWFDRG